MLLDKISKIVNAVIIGLAFLSIWLYASTKSIEVSTFHMDGAYQTASVLFRIMQGELPGKDFFSYLGLGPTYLLFPLFYLKGTTLASSTFSSHFMVALMTCIAFGIMIGLTQDKNKWKIGAFASVLCLSLFNIGFFMGTPIGISFEPGNSLRPLRAFAPYLGILFAYLIINSKISDKHKIGWASLALAMILTWSNDFGIPTALVMGILFIVKLNKSRGLILLPVLATAIHLLMLSLISGGHAVDILSYNFMDVRKDQYWYFTTWHKETRIYGLRDGIIKVASDLYPYLNLTLLVVTLNIIFIRRFKYMLAILGALFIGGLLASVGGHIGGYFIAFIAGIEISACVILFQGIKEISAYLKIKRYAFIELVLAVLLLGLVSIACGLKYESWSAKKELSNSIYWYPVPELGGVVPLKFKKQIEFIREHKKDTVFEEYWGLWGGITSLNNKEIKVDALIHALGSKREEVLSILKKDPPAYLVTTNINLEPMFQPWAVSANWWFYKWVLNNYTIELESPSSLIWKKVKPAPDLFEPVPCSIVNNAVKISSDAPGFFDVTIKYSKNKIKTLRSIFMIRNNYDPLPHTSDYLAINLNSNTFNFMTKIKDPNQLLDIRAESIRDVPANLELESCEASRITKKMSPSFLEP